jgi:C-terminal processing protease CtpA/Prc
LISFQNAEDALKLEFSWVFKPNSDHYPFFKRNIPALLLHTGLHDQYHSPRDDARLINNQGIRRVSRLLFAMVYELADGEQVPGFRKAARHETKTGTWLLALLTPRLPRRLGAHWDPKESATDGLRLTHIDAGSAAEEAKLKVGDRIVEFAGRKINGGEELRAAVLATENSAKAIVRRAGQDEPLTVTVHLAGKPLRMGIAWRIDDAEPGTVILTYVAPGSPADRAGLHPGDRIYQVAGRDFSDDRQFARMIETTPEPLELLVERDGRLRTVVIHIETEPLDRAA